MSSDLRKLAERIAEAVWQAGDAYEGQIERILREDREALAQAMIVPEYEHWSPHWKESSAEFGIWWMSVRAQKILRGEITREELEGGEQAERDTPDCGVRSTPTPAAPDPHEFEPYPTGYGGCSRILDATDDGRGAIRCHRPADDPIHDEVNDGMETGAAVADTAPASLPNRGFDSGNGDAKGDATGTTQNSGRDPAPHEFKPWRDTAHAGCSHRKLSGSPCFLPADDPIHDVPQVTNYDLSALSGDDTTRTQSTDDGSQDVSPAYVGPGDEVRYLSESAVVVGPHPDDNRLCAVIIRADGALVMRYYYDLRTPDGRPVAGFRERLDGPYMTTTAQDLIDARNKRIAELERKLKKERKTHKQVCRKYAETIRNVERQRDEALTERDRFVVERANKIVEEMPDWKTRGFDNAWVRLTDEDIERIVKEFYAPDQGSLQGVLRDYRDGKLKGERDE